jgi:hypothetical protein
MFLFPNHVPTAGFVSHETLCEYHATRERPIITFKFPTIRGK